jgi:hypothetical protein
LFGNGAVTFQTELAHLMTLEQSRISRTVRRVTRRAAFDFERRVFKDKRTLFIRVAFKTGAVVPDRQFGLSRFKTAVRVVTIAALHLSFQNFVTERFVEMRFDLAVTADTKLLFTGFKHRRSGIQFGRSIGKRHRTVFERAVIRSVRRMTIRAADIVAPVFAAAKLIVVFLAGVTGETSFRNLFRVFVFK